MHRVIASIIFFAMISLDAVASAEAASATIQIYVVNQRTVCGKHPYSDAAGCPTLTHEEFRRLQDDEQIPRLPQQEIQLLVQNSGEFQFNDTLVGNANDYIVHLSDYSGDEREAALVVFRWNDPVPNIVTITRIDRKTHKQICRFEPKSGKEVCGYTRHPERFFVYHYAFELISNAKLKVETREPKSVLSFGP